MAVRVAVVLARKGTDVATIVPSATLADAARALAEHNVGALVVSTDGDIVEGMLSERDIVRRLATSGADCLAMSVAEVMTAEVTACTRDTTVDELMATMTERQIRHIPVVEQGRLAGIISIRDVVQSRMEELEVQAETMQEYITGSGY